MTTTDDDDDARLQSRLHSFRGRFRVYSHKRPTSTVAAKDIMFPGTQLQVEELLIRAKPIMPNPIFYYPPRTQILQDIGRLSYLSYASAEQSM